VKSGSLVGLKHQQVIFSGPVLEIFTAAYYIQITEGNEGLT
jgi:hypothetical protein